MSTSRRLLVSLLGLLLCAFVAMAQTETGQITGTVLDPAGGLIANANVTVKNLDTGATRVTKTGSAGEYIVTNLLPGNYSVSAAAAGFSQLEQRVTLTVGTKVGVDLKLQVASAAATVVEVSEAAVQVNTETQTLSTNVSSQQLRELPTITRNPYLLAGVSGNVSDAGTGMGGASAGARGVGFAVNGLREASTNVLLDGSANNDSFTAGVGQQVPLDSLQEFSLLTNNFTAEYGGASGAIVNVVTKSGTNDFHGTAYEFNRVSALSSNSFNNNAYDIPKSVFTRNQFGYSVGGPIKKDKLFFFSSTEWTRIRSNAVQEVMIPDPALIAASAASTQQFFSAYGKLAPGANVLQTYSINQLSALGNNLCGSNAACNSLNPNMPVYDLVGFSVPQDAGGGNPVNLYTTNNRVDYNLSDKTIIYGRYAVQGDAYTAGFTGFSPYQGFNTSQTDFDNNILVSVIHNFNPNWTSQSKAVFNRLKEEQPLNGPPVPTLYTGPTGGGSLLGQPIYYPGYTPSSPGLGLPFGGPQNFVQLYEDVSYTRGSHTFRFGGSYTYLRDNRTFGAYETAGEYLGTGSDASAMAGLLSGQLHEFQVAIYPQGQFPGATINFPLTQPNFSRSFRYNEGAAYAQDSWKIKPRFTVNLGLRWEYYGVQHNKNPELDSNFYMPANEIGTPQGFHDGMAELAPQSPVGGFWKPDYHDFAPRLGFAWDIFGDGKTSLRGGYGIAYERNFGNVTFNAIQNPPNYLTASVVSPAYNLPISASNLGPFSATTGTLAVPPASLRVPIQNITTAYAHLWSASLERRITNNLLVAIDYSGSKGVNLYDISVDNRYGYGNVFLGMPCSYDAGDCTAKLNNQYSGINVRGNNAWSNYESMNLRSVVDNLGNSGVHLNFNYTWSHAIDNLSTTFSDANSLAANWGDEVVGLLDPFSPNINKGNADFDIRQRVAVSAIWDVPAGKSSKGWEKQVLGGWQLAPIFTARTGSPYTIFDCTNAYNFCPMAAFTGPVPVAANGNAQPVGQPNTFNFLNIPSTVDHYTNPTYFYSDLPPFPSDMTSRNEFRAPGTWDMDFGIYKTVSLKERFKLQIRGEFYNLFNHANLYVEGVDADVSSVNYIPACKACTQTFLDRRNVQLAAKLIF